MRSRRSLIAVLTLTTALTALTAGSATVATAAVSPPAGPVPKLPVVTLAQAKAELVAYTATVNTANKTYNTALRDTVEGGAARILDDADYRLSELVGYRPYAPIKNVKPQLLVPRQAHYPVVFVALTRLQYGSYKVSSTAYAMLFQKASASAAWKLTAAPAFKAANVPTFTVDKQGYLPALDGSTLAVSPSALYPALIKAEGLAAQGKKPSAAWSYNSLLRYLGPRDADEKQTYASSYLAPVCLASRTGALCIASTTGVEVDTLTAAELASGTGYVIDSPSSQYDAGGVAQGRYTDLRIVSLLEAAVVVPRKHSKTPLVVTGLSGGPINGRGTLAPAM